MARVFITGSADGLGQLAARRLVAQNHQVVLHARDERRGADALAGVPAADGVLIGELARIDDVERLAAEANRSGRFDAVIHNAGVYRASGEDILAVNTLAPYILTCRMDRPERLVYIGSGEHLRATPTLAKLRSGNRAVSYADSKLHVLLLSNAVARRWTNVYSNVVDPGWVPTKMGGPGASDDLDKGYETQAWLAVGTDRAAKMSGRYLYHRKEARHHASADDVALQDELLAVCEKITGVALRSD